MNGALEDLFSLEGRFAIVTGPTGVLGGVDVGRAVGAQGENRTGQGRAGHE